MTIAGDAPCGAHVVGGRLFFELLDGSSVSCNCIAEPYASQVVEACTRNDASRAILDAIGRDLENRKRFLGLLKDMFPDLTIPEPVE